MALKLTFVKFSSRLVLRESDFSQSCPKNMTSISFWFQHGAVMELCFIVMALVAKGSADRGSCTVLEVSKHSRL